MNKRPLVITLVFWACTCALNGQLPSSFGAKGGIALANQSYRITAIDHTLETQALSGPALFLFVEAFKARHFSLQVDAGYVGKGSSTTTESVTVNHLDNDRITIQEGEASTSNFTYLSFVPMARCRWDLGKWSPYLLLGPRIDFLLSYRSESSYPLEEQNRTIVGLSVGAGMEYTVQPLGFFAEWQYLPDLSPVTHRDPLLIKHYALSLTLGIRWSASGE
jgi:hypothetical protein